MGMLRRLREWREKRDGTLEGPALHTEELNTEKSSTIATLSADQTIEHDTTTIISFDQTELNQIGFDTTNNQFVAPEDGTYSITADIGLGDDGAEVLLNIRIDSSSALTEDIRQTVNRFETVSTPTKEVELTAGQAVDVAVRIRTDDTDPSDILSDANRTFLRVRRV